MERKKAQHGGVRGSRQRNVRTRGVVAAQVAVCLTTLCGFAALTIDVGMMYHARTELQRTVDAAALAAAVDLGDYSGGDPQESARATAVDFASRNEVLMGAVELDPEADVVFGRAYINDGSNRYVFEPTIVFPNAVQIRARKTAPLYFANVFGIASTQLSARATAVLTPRDIALVLDLSGSHNDDSSLRSYKRLNIDNREVWESLWDTSISGPPTVNGLACGPSFGNMDPWGTTITGPGWDYANDSGLIRLPKGSNWTLSTTWASQTLNATGYGNYTSSEMSVIKSGSGESTTSYRRRVRVALGLDRWRSGKSGGQSGGNGDNVIDSWEVVPMVPYPSNATNPETVCKQVGGDWNSYIDYVISTSSSMCRYDPNNDYYGDSGLRYRYGLKTWVDYLQEKEYGDSQSPGMAGSPTQPMGAVADGVTESINIVEALDGDDFVGIASYGTIGYGPTDRPAHMSWLTDDFGSLRSRVSVLQAAMWTNYTNVAQGIDEGVKVLFDSPNARSNAAKVMLLLTDGNANQRRNTPSNNSGGSSPYYSEYWAREDAKEAALDARDEGVRIYTISVGVNADTSLMQEIADSCNGEHFAAAGDIATYRAQLQDIFRKLGGKRPVVLIE